MKRALINAVATFIGAGTGGSAFVYASQGAVSWWFVVAIFVWVIAVAVACMS